MTLAEFVKAGEEARQLAKLLAGMLDEDPERLNSHDCRQLNEWAGRLHKLTVAMKRDMTD